MSKEIQQWEYETVYLRRTESNNKMLREMGEQGWELCGLDIERSPSGCEYGTYFIFKRPKQQP
jgi:hypothetical protein